MTRFLAIVRRIFWGGTISLLLCVFLFGVAFSSMLELALAHESINGFFAIYFLVSPVLFLICTLISVAYIRHHGQLAAFHQMQLPIKSFFRCWGSDIAAPFKNIGYFFIALFNKNTIGRGVLIGRFMEMLILIVICAVGIYILM